MILVSKNVRYMRIFAGFLGEGRQMTVGLSKTVILTVLISYLFGNLWQDIIIIIIITRTMFMVLSSWLRVIARVHPVHAMNAEQSQLAADPWTKLIIQYSDYYIECANVIKWRHIYAHAFVNRKCWESRAQTDRQWMRSW